MKTLPYSDNIMLKNISVFGGITDEHRATDGDILNSRDTTSDKYPWLTPREARTLYSSTAGRIINCVPFLGKLAVMTENGNLYWNGNSYNIGNTDTNFVSLGNYLCGFSAGSNGFYIHSYPAYYTYTGGIMEQTTPHDAAIDVLYVGEEVPESASIGDIWIDSVGTIREYTSDGWAKTGNTATVGKVYRMYITEPLTYMSYYKRYSHERYESLSFSPCDSEGNTGSTHIKLECATTAWLSYFGIGDFVRIYDANPSNTTESKKHVYAALSDGVTVTAAGTGYIVVTCPSGADMIKDKHYQSGDLRIERCAPMLEHVCAHNNRIYGSCGSTIYISALGNPTQFSNFSLSSTSPWAVDTCGENFTGCISYDNSVVFFKEREIYRVYGDTPSEFRFTKTVCPGVRADSSKSLAACNGYLYYNSYSGVMRYGGGYPVCISANAGIGANATRAVGGADDIKYYMYSGHLLYVYDTRYGIWHIETIGNVIYSFCNIGAALFASGQVISGQLDGKYLNTSKGVSLSAKEEAAPTSETVFADITEGTLYRKSYKRIRLRVKVESGTLRVYIAYDGDYEKKLLLELSADDAGEKNIQKRDIIPERCDSFRLYIEGDGKYTVYSIDREYEISTDNG